MWDLNKNSNLEIPSRWRRLFVFLLDLAIFIICFVPFFLAMEFRDFRLAIIILVISIILYIVFIVLGRTTFWNKILWIVTLNSENNLITKKQFVLRYFVFSVSFSLPILLSILYSRMSLLLINVMLIKGRFMSVNIGINIFKYIFYLLGIFVIIVLIVNIIELFVECPTFIDKRLWIKRVYKKSN